MHPVAIKIRPCADKCHLEVVDIADPPKHDPDFKEITMRLKGDLKEIRGRTAGIMNRATKNEQDIEKMLEKLNVFLEGK